MYPAGCRSRSSPANVLLFPLSSYLSSAVFLFYNASFSLFFVFYVIFANSKIPGQMDKVRLFDKTFRTFIPYERITEAIDRVAEKINADFRGCEDIPVLLCVLNGSIMFTAELMRRLEFNCELVSVKLTSYQGTGSTGKVKQALGLTADIRDRRVIIVEDIVDTGNTIVELKRIMEENGAAESRICTLLFKPDSYSKDIPLDYVAMEIPNDFIVGFGLDYNEIGRSLKDIYVLDNE